jgi:hypothetical protein
MPGLSAFLNLFKFSFNLESMKRGVIGLSLLLAMSLFPANAATPPKAGSVCSKQGITDTYKGKKYTCIKSRKKLVWSKGTSINSKKKVDPPATTAPLKPLAPVLSLAPDPDPSITEKNNGAGKKFIIEIPAYSLSSEIVLQGQLLPTPNTAAYLWQRCRYDSFEGEEIVVWKIPRTPLKIYCWAASKTTEVSFRTHAIKHNGKLDEIGYCGVDCYDAGAIVTSSDWAATISLKD